MSYYAKECVKTGRKGAYGTADFIKIFGGKTDYSLNPKIQCTDKDAMITMMANTIMELTSRGKFNLRDF